MTSVRTSKRGISVCKIFQKRRGLKEEVYKLYSAVSGVKRPDPCPIFVSALTGFHELVSFLLLQVYE